MGEVFYCPKFYHPAENAKKNLAFLHKAAPEICYTTLNRIFPERSRPYEQSHPRPFCAVPQKSPRLRLHPAGAHGGPGAAVPGQLGRDLRRTGRAFAMAGRSGAGFGHHLPAAGGRGQLAHHPQPSAGLFAAARRRQRVDGHLRQRHLSGGRGRAHADLLPAPVRPAARPRRRAHDPAVRLPQNDGATLRHRAAAVAPQLAGRPHHGRAALPARRLRRGGRGHRRAGAALRVAAGAAAGPLGAGQTAPERNMAGPPGALADPAGHPERREPPPAGRKAPLPCPAGRPRSQAVSPVQHPVPLHPLHGAALFPHLWAGAAAGGADVLPLQRPAQCGGHGLHRDGLSAGLRVLFLPGPDYEHPDALPHRQLLLGHGGERRAKRLV